MYSNYISIGIPVYNAESYLEYAIKSVLAQTHEFWELIIIDDGSTDQSLNIARKYEEKDKRIRVISDGYNKKLPFRLNQLTQESKYDYIARMDADDIMHPERLKTQLSFLLKHPEYDLVSSGLISIDNNNNIKGYRSVDNLDDDFSSYRSNYPILHPSLLGYKSWFERNIYSESFPRAEDYELWCRAISRRDFKIAVLPDLLLFYREEGNLNSKKLLETYNDVLNIRLIYCHEKRSKYLLDVFKKYLKTAVVKFLDTTNNLQMLAKHRNKRFSSEESLSAYQKILSNMIKDSEDISTSR